MDATIVARELTKLLSGHGVPDYDRSILGTGCESPPVWTEHHRCDSACMPNLRYGLEPRLRARRSSAAAEWEADHHGQSQCRQHTYGLAHFSISSNWTAARIETHTRLDGMPRSSE